MPEDPFLNDTHLHRLTGFAFKSKQIAWLRKEGIPFRVSATGHPVVTWEAVQGRETTAPAAPQRWTPRVVGAH
ncbi:DUF4224 domain-containing protein [Acidovorax sp. Root219]|uniref:DUF4224 domain-containing protein n=1 Tax=Acidovorax sp. Root219 TaxID=1736493 RepID=UPI000ABCD3F0|nr:DUF4224 domain-containing protein [Acidovorax sp. Root219]